MPKRAYIATAKVEIIVVADSEDAAKTVAANAMMDDIRLDDGDFQLSPLSFVPGAYHNIEEDLIHHDGDGDITVAQALKLPGGYEHRAT
jgi:hypothetical protein